VKIIRICCYFFIFHLYHLCLF